MWKSKGCCLVSLNLKEDNFFLFGMIIYQKPCNISTVFSALLLHLFYVCFRATLTVLPHVHTWSEVTPIYENSFVLKNMFSAIHVQLPLELLKFYLAISRFLLYLLVYCTVQEKYCCWEKDILFHLCKVK